MGMFDYVRVEDPSMLPVESPERFKNGFQTKSFDCLMEVITITKDRRLVVKRVEYEVTPENELPDKSFPLLGCIRPKSHEFVDLDFHGKFCFYGDINNEWFDFVAKFTDGNLVSIERKGQETP